MTSQSTAPANGSPAAKANHVCIGHLDAFKDVAVDVLDDYVGSVPEARIASIAGDFTAALRKS